MTQFLLEGMLVFLERLNIFLRAAMSVGMGFEVLDLMRVGLILNRAGALHLGVFHPLLEISIATMLAAFQAERSGEGLSLHISRHRN
jgi:hypothetical protein